MAKKITKINKLLVANRGEIATRIFRAATELGIRTVAIYSEEDKRTLHRYKADEAYMIGKGLGPLRAYLSIEDIISLAKKEGVDAIHPGYGFLSENDQFATACEEAGILFIGPSAEVIAAMGNKVEAKKIASRINLPLIPGSDSVPDEETALRLSREIGFPVMLKASYGGGGRGMRIANDSAELKKYFKEASSESLKAFGRSDIFIEKYVDRPKHIEVQVLGDNHGNVVHCYERDCSIQRRHQKVVEFAPAICLKRSNETLSIRNKMHEAALKLSREIGYRSAGTVEFLYDPDAGKFYFMEMNTRIQVEHTVTEMLTGIDLVKSQILIAENYALSDNAIGIAGQDSIETSGVSIQCRVTTEDPATDFTPDYGRLSAYRSPSGFGIRLDAGNAYAGAVISPFYDSLLVKVSSWGRNISEAASRMDRALAEFRLRGLKTNIHFMRKIMQDANFLSGDTRTDYLDVHPHLTDIPIPKDRASKLLAYIAEVSVNGNPIVKKKVLEVKRLHPSPPAMNDSAELQEGTRQILDKKGPEGLVKWIKSRKEVLVTDLTFRDAHQSLLATRMRTYDMLEVARGMATHFPQMFSYEMWGGATFDASMRFLKEDPWERLAEIREAIPNTLLQMLLRGANAVGYTNYPENVIRRFVQLSANAGIDLFRIFDSLNWLPNMITAIDEVRNVNKIAEASICYTGNIEDNSRTKYSLKYYVDLAKELEKAGAQILAIKDMAGLLRPYSARILVKALREETDMPIHLHSHDTSGIQGATLLFAVETGVDIIDCAISGLSGLTSHPNLESIVAALQFHKRNTGIDLKKMVEYGHYWEEVRKNYGVFESEMRSGTASVYDHEMPGGQYTNLRSQAEAMGLGDRWQELIVAYQDANELFGDIIKVTPSSKVVGDMALFMLTNDLKLDNFYEKAGALSFPESVKGMLKGQLGKPYGGFPKKITETILKNEATKEDGGKIVLPPIDFEEEKEKLRKKFGVRKSGYTITDYHAMSSIMYPQVTSDYLEHKKNYGDTYLLPTPVFLYGLKLDEEIVIHIEKGKTLYIMLLSISEPGIDGYRTVFFELNGHLRDVRVRDKSLGIVEKENIKADPENLHHLGSPIPGRVVQVMHNPGDAVKEGDTLLVLEAMKMETSVTAPRDTNIGNILVKPGDTVEAADLLVEFK